MTTLYYNYIKYFKLKQLTYFYILFGILVMMVLHIVDKVIFRVHPNLVIWVLIKFCQSADIRQYSSLSTKYSSTSRRQHAMAEACLQSEVE